eukprot:1226148-Amphidinium_carterae.3
MSMLVDLHLRQELSNLHGHEHRVQNLKCSTPHPTNFSFDQPGARFRTRSDLGAEYISENIATGGTCYKPHVLLLVCSTLSGHKGPLQFPAQRDSPDQPPQRMIAAEPAAKQESEALRGQEPALETSCPACPISSSLSGRTSLIPKLWQPRCNGAASNLPVPQFRKVIAPHLACLQPRSTGASSLRMLGTMPCGPHLDGPHENQAELLPESES